MVVVRPVAIEDLEQVVELAGAAGYGLTTLPKDPELLRGRILESQASFQRACKRPRGESYLFVLEDLRTGKVVGTSGVVAKVGGFEPFYAYKIETTVAESDVLNVRKEIRFLKLWAEHNGPCEIASLFLAPGYRKGGYGRVLSLARFLFMAEFPERFDPLVIAEMRGVIDEQGNSPFWNALGKNFFDVDFPTADYLSMVNKKFIADLMPTHPIYIPLLPKEAQAVIGQVHEQTRPARRVLEAEGFGFCDMVDIFDAGPLLSCKRDQIRTVKTSTKAKVEDIAEDRVVGEECLIASMRQGFRVCKGVVQVTEQGGVRLSGPVALTLNVKVGDAVRFAAMRPAGAKEKQHEPGEEPIHSEPVV